MRICHIKYWIYEKEHNRNDANTASYKHLILLYSFTEMRQLLIYPPGKGGIAINAEDYLCLAQDQFLNDVIIDFYLKYLWTDVLAPQMQEKVYIFSSFFYKRLTTKPAKATKYE